MRFIVMIRSTADSEAGVPPSRELLTAMGRYNEELVRAGVLLAGEGLHPSSRGARVTFSADGTTVTDGPFHDGDLVAGFWLLQTRSRDEAIEWARRIPNPDNQRAQVEVRQVVEAADLDDGTEPKDPNGAGEPGDTVPRAHDDRLPDRATVHPTCRTPYEQDPNGPRPRQAS